MVSDYRDWGDASIVFDLVQSELKFEDLSSENEAQTRHDVIDRMIHEVLGWKHGQVRVEQGTEAERVEYTDYVLLCGDNKIIVEAKSAGAAFPTPTRRRKLKLSGSVLKQKEVSSAIDQVIRYSKSLSASTLAVTNGSCWCVFPSDYEEDTHASLFFPFDNPSDAEDLYNILSPEGINRGNLDVLLEYSERIEYKLLSIVQDADARIDRNNIANHIEPALTQALYSSALLADDDALKECFITTVARTKFDHTLGIHLSDTKPALVKPARRLRTGRSRTALGKTLSDGEPMASPPLTLIIGPVGAGKTTYLKHFERISGSDILHELDAQWVYIDFEKLGRGGNPRGFIYRTLRDYLTDQEKVGDTSALVKSAYREHVENLRRGPLVYLAKDEEKLNEKISEYISSEYEEIEPYVERLLNELSTHKVCVLVLDNVDLYEDEELESTVFSEGLALTKRIRCHVLVSIRDTTFIRHRSDSVFDAYELRKLWLDPPPLETVLSSRLQYAKSILSGKSIELYMRNKFHTRIPDLGEFFTIVQSSTLRGTTGKHIANYADTNIRKGLELISNFMTSGHVQADRAISNYVAGQTSYTFPTHEIFKGMMLGQWKYYKEGRADCINVFDARMGASRLQLLRLQILDFLFTRAKGIDTVETSCRDIIAYTSVVGATERQILNCIEYLISNRLLRNIIGGDIDSESVVAITACGAYYYKQLCRTFVYVESVLMDTAITDRDAWNELEELSIRIENTREIAPRMEIRGKRVEKFLDYLKGIEEISLNQGNARDSHKGTVDTLRAAVSEQVKRAVKSALWRYGKKSTEDNI